MVSAAEELMMTGDMLVCESGEWRRVERRGVERVCGERGSRGEDPGSLYRDLRGSARGM